MPTSWDSVAANPKYQSLPPDQQEAARKQYFDQVIAPKVPKQDVETARKQFDNYASSKSSTPASAPTKPQPTMTGDISAMHKMGDNEPGYEYGDVLPFKKNTATGERSFAVPEMIRAPLRGMGDLMQTAQNKDTKATPDSVAAMTTMMGAAKPVTQGLTKAADAATPGVSAMLKDTSSGGAKRPVISPEERANTYIAKTLLAGGKSPDEALETMSNARKRGLTAGESSKNPELLGLEQKISKMNRPGGAAVRGHAEDRVNPDYTSSIPSQLRDTATSLQARNKVAGKELSAVAATAPKTPLNMAHVLKPLSQEEPFSNTPTASTVNRLKQWASEAQAKGNTFQAWHELKQNIAHLRSEAKNPESTAEKMDLETIDKYYKKVNDVLSGRAPGLPENFRNTANAYALKNAKYAETISGSSIAATLKKMPQGGTPAQKLNFLYKKLAGSEEAQDSILNGMPESERKGMMNLLKAINDAARPGLTDVTKTGEPPAVGLPMSKHGAISRLKDWVMDMVTRKDYDALGRALTNPDIRYVSEKILNKASPARAAGKSAGSSGSQVPWDLADQDTSKIDKFINGEKLKRLQGPQKEDSLLPEN